MRFDKYGVLATLFLLLAAFSAMADEPAVAPAKQDVADKLPRKIPIADFVSRPTFINPIISPDGTMVVGKVRQGDQSALMIHSFEQGRVGLLALPAELELRYYRWAGNGRILMSFLRTSTIYGYEFPNTVLISYDLATKEKRPITRKRQGLEGDDVLYIDPDGRWLLLSLSDSITDGPDVYRVDLDTLAMTEVVKKRYGVSEWYADEGGTVRAGVGWDERSWYMYYRRSEADPFRKLPRVKYDDEDAAYDVLRFLKGSDEGYVLNNKETGRYALYRFNYATKETGEKLFESSTNDITDFRVNRDGTGLEAVWFTDDRDRVKWFDPDMDDAQTRLDKAVPGQEAWISSISRNRRRMLVWVGGSADPGAYYLYDRDKRRLEEISVQNDKLAIDELAPSKYVSFKARDGLEIHGYLTVPLGRPARNLPLIVMPHGGPYGVRDKGDFDPDVQMLANRGYVVFQPNYRGSEGYGLPFYEKGEGQWGRQMQDDLDDGMDWLVEQGIADKSRVCIVGISYGGYAALWGATRNPERYRCAVSFAGISDVGRQLRYQNRMFISPRYRKDWQRKVRGEASFDLDSVSPLKNIASLRVPLLILHGGDDSVVPPSQSGLYANALKAAGKTYEYHVYPGEGHGPNDPENMKDWLERLEAFLAKYNPA